MFSVCASSLFQRSKHAEAITKPRNTGNYPVVHFKNSELRSNPGTATDFMCVYVSMSANALIACVNSNYMNKCALG